MEVTESTKASIGHCDGSNANRTYYSAKETFFGLQRHNFTRLWFPFAHFFGLQGIFMIITGQIPLRVILFFLFHGYMAGLGLTVAGHRYWAHRSFKAKLPMRLMMIYMHTAAGQLPVFEYVRVHRPHHKYADTEADPHNAQKGFWHSQILWTMQKERPEVIEKRNTFNFTDVDNDPLVRFQSRYYTYLTILTMFVIPLSIYHYLWPEASLYTLLCVNLGQYILHTHLAFLANSATHLYGKRPFIAKIFPRENILTAFLTFGEGYHNYHHAFPWDYKISEHGFGFFNVSTGFIEFCAWLGWAYDLKTASPKVVEYKVTRHGDGTHSVYGHHNKGSDSGAEGPFRKLPHWGLEDEDTPLVDFQYLHTVNPSKAGYRMMLETKLAKN